jgi:hypothetical protein
VSGAGDPHLRQVREGPAGRLHLGEKPGYVDAAVRRRVRPEAPGGLLELAFAADGVPATRLVPRDRHVHEALEEVAFGRLAGPPDVLEDLVGGEVLALLDEREPALQLRLRP